MSNWTIIPRSVWPKWIGTPRLTKVNANISTELSKKKSCQVWWHMFYQVWWAVHWLPRSVGRKRAGRFKHAGIFLHDPVVNATWSWSEPALDEAVVEDVVILEIIPVIRATLHLEGKIRIDKVNNLTILIIDVIIQWVFQILTDQEILQVYPN